MNPPICVLLLRAKPGFSLTLLIQWSERIHILCSCIYCSILQLYYNYIYIYYIVFILYTYIILYDQIIMYHTYLI